MAATPRNRETGSSGSDVSLPGTSGRDKIFGLGGEDILFGLPGGDILKGGAGDDTLNGGRGRDFLKGGAGNDDLRGGRGNDVLFNDAGVDILEGGLGDDTAVFEGATALVISAERNWYLDGDTWKNDSEESRNTKLFWRMTDGASEHNYITGIERLDVKLASSATNVDLAAFDGKVKLEGGDVDNELTGSSTANSLLRGKGGDDTLTGGAGNDTLRGDRGRDTLTGGAGDDTLIGGFGTDTMTGGDGADTFVLTKIQAGRKAAKLKKNADVIKDFTVDVDKLEIDIKGYKNGEIFADQDGSDTVLALKKNGADSKHIVAVLEGVTASNLDNDDFMGVTTVEIV